MQHCYRYTVTVDMPTYLKVCSGLISMTISSWRNIVTEASTWVGWFSSAAMPVFAVSVQKLTLLRPDNGLDLVPRPMYRPTAVATARYCLMCAISLLL